MAAVATSGCNFSSLELRSTDAPDARTWLIAMINDETKVADAIELYGASELLDHPDLPTDCRAAAAEAVLRVLARSSVERLCRQDVEAIYGGIWVTAVLHRAGWAAVDYPFAFTAGEHARAVLYPERAPHAALAWRCSGLYASKQNNYVLAGVYFEEAQSRLNDWSRNGGRDTARLTRTINPNDPGGELADMFDETEEQVLLGRSGTAVRTVERLLITWVLRAREQREQQRKRQARYHEQIAVEYERLTYLRAYKGLRWGILAGERSSEIIREVRTVPRRNVTRLAIKNWSRRPGVMTARNHLLAIPLCTMLEEEGARHPEHGSDWARAIRVHQDGFFTNYRIAAGRIHVSTEGSGPTIEVGADNQHRRELAQLRLTFGLMYPGRSLEVEVDDMEQSIAEDPVLSDTRVDVEKHAVWLRDHSADGNVIASITCPRYLAKLVELNPDLDYVAFLRRFPWLPRRDAADAIDAFLSESENP
jgi:hypothetical protein